MVGETASSRATEVLERAARLPGFAGAVLTRLADSARLEGRGSAEPNAATVVRIAETAASLDGPAQGTMRRGRHSGVRPDPEQIVTSVVVETDGHSYAIASNAQGTVLAVAAERGAVPAGVLKWGVEEGCRAIAGAVAVEESVALEAHAAPDENAPAAASVESEGPGRPVETELLGEAEDLGQSVEPEPEDLGRPVEPEPLVEPDSTGFDFDAWLAEFESSAPHLSS